MVTDVGGLGDKSFNDLSYEGLKRAEEELGVEIEVLESKEITDYESNIDQLANAGYSPIFAVGFLMTDTVVEDWLRSIPTRSSAASTSSSIPPWITWSA